MLGWDERGCDEILGLRFEARELKERRVFIFAGEEKSGSGIYDDEWMS